jgi:hypothetical protein
MKKLIVASVKELEVFNRIALSDASRVNRTWPQREQVDFPVS